MNADVVIVGGGHNGMVCAALLARAGRKVMVVEARPMVGGFATTENPFEDFPAVRSSMTSLDIAAANLAPSVIDELALEKLGLAFHDLDPFHSYVGPDGSSLIFWRDVERTCEEIARLSRKDAAAYRRLSQDFTVFWQFLAPYLQANPRRPGLKTVLKMIAVAGRHPLHLANALRMMNGNPREIIETRFESHAVRAALGIMAAAGGYPLDQPKSGMVVGMLALQHLVGVRRPIGGMGMFSNALRASGERHGVQFVTGKAVKRLTMEAGRVSGVELEDGEKISARAVVGALDPVTLMRRLLPPEHLSETLKRELDEIEIFKANIAAARVDILLERSPDLVGGNERVALLLPSTIFIGPTALEALQSYLANCARGKIGDDIPLWAAVPSQLDRSLIPDDPTRQVIHIYLPAVPFELENGRSWDSLRDDVGQKVLRQLERVMPNLAPQVLGVSVRTPLDIARTSGLTRGCLYHVDMSATQMGPNRPTRSLAGYKTPIPGLWHTGAGAHPMGAISGISGRLAAEAILKTSDLARP